MMPSPSSLIASVHASGGDVKIRDGQLVVTAATPLPQSLMEELRQAKPNLIAFLADGNDGDFGDRAAITQFDACIPAEWAEGFAKLQTMPVPGDMPIKRWQQVINDAGLFLEPWAAQATALGWTTLDVFGIHHSKLYGGIQCSGLVALIGGNTVTAITADTCSIRHSNGVINRYYRRAAQPGQIPLWECRP